MTDNQSRRFEPVLRLLGPVLLALGLLASVFAAQRMGVDFATLHAMGRGIVHGIDVYDPVWFKAEFAERYQLGAPPGMFYPPATGFVLVPFGVLPYAAGKLAWLAALALGVVFGVRVLVRFVAPSEPSYVWMATAGLVLVSSAVRWGMTPLQGAPLVLAFLCWFFVALQQGKYATALCIAVVVTAFKVTLALPFLGLLLLHRRYSAIAASLAAAISLNVLGFLRMGGESLQHYRAGMAVVEAIDDINTPDPWLRISIPRLDWTYLYYGLTENLVFSRVACLATGAAVGLFLAYRTLKLKVRPTLPVTAAFMACWVCLGSLSVYHHHYDICLFLAPTLVAIFGPATLRQPSWAVLSIAPLLVWAAVLPVAKVQNLIEATLSVRAIGLLNLSFPLFFSLALAGSLGVLLRQLTSNEPAQVPAVGLARP